MENSTTKAIRREQRFIGEVTESGGRDQEPETKARTRQQVIVGEASES